MNTSNNVLINEKMIDQMIEKIRLSSSHALKKYLDLYKKYDQLMTDVIEEKLKRRFFQKDLVFYDENGKINWEVIQQVVPSEMEKIIRLKYNMLNDNEIRLYILLFFHLSDKTIANILPYKQQSIGPVIGKIRKKAGVKDIQEIHRFIVLNGVLEV